MINFPYDLTDDFEEIVSAEEYAPGVFYLIARRLETAIATEYYVLREDNPIISEEAKRYGERLEFNDDVLCYTLLNSKDGKQIVEYELQRYRMRNGLAPLENVDTIDLATFAMENHPEYFGAYPAPYSTPRGRMLRYKTLMNGVFVLETERFERLIAVAFPIWDCELSVDAQMIAETLPYEAEGYRFYDEKAGSQVLFELMLDHRELATSPYIDAAALMNALWSYNPTFAAAHNYHEVKGDNDVGARILQLLGEDIKPQGKAENLVYIHPEAGTDYLKI